MKKYFILFLLLLMSTLFAQNLIHSEQNSFHPSRILLQQDQYVKLSAELNDKVLSGKLLEKISSKMLLAKEAAISASKYYSKVILYFSSEPSAEQKEILKNEGLECYWELWTPPSHNHPFGYVVADMPVSKFENTISLDFIKKMDTAEYESHPHNNNGNQSVRAPEVWNAGFDGSGIKVGVLDSGLDSFYMGTDLPSSYDAADYSNYPSVDYDVENHVSGHGTHVVGSVLGRGVLSNGQSHVNNGEGAFKGVAPGASLAFFKIGGDESSNASDAAEIAAIDAAVNDYSVDVLSMSYGGWGAYHDGSGSVEQKVDWAYDQGVPFFISAGNEGESARHFSGTVNAGSSTDYIEVNVSDPGGEDVTLWFNLVWYDGLGTHNDLTVKYYDASKTELGNVVISQRTESLRGTESRYSHYDNYIENAGTYYIKVFNNSSSNQFFHLYDDWGSHVTFVNPDEFYTIGSPATADNACAVGAYVSRETWTDSNGDSWWYGESYALDGIAHFSSRGPRVDGAQKPDITAPGHVILSLRDTDVYTAFSTRWIDNDGTSGGNANYYAMRGTSMACPHAAGAAALLLESNPSLSPGQVYSIMQNNANTSGLPALPDPTWGYGKIDIYEAVMASGSAAVASVDVDYLTIQLGPDQIESVEFILSNIGGTDLTFDISVDGDFEGYAANTGNNYTIDLVEGNNNSSSNRNNTKEIDSEVYELKAVPNKNKSEKENLITGDDYIILDDGGSYADAFLGFGNGNDFKWRNEFVLSDYDFELDAFNFYMRTESASTNIVYVEVLDESLNVLAEGQLEFSTSTNGNWFRATLNNPISFSQGETFSVTIETQGTGIDFPAGTDQFGTVSDHSYYFNGSSWVNLNTFSGYESGAFLIRAEGTKGGASADRITISPNSGTIAVGSSETIMITFDATGLGESSYSGNVNIITNGGDIIIPIDYVVGVNDNAQLPLLYSLEQNYPNPFNPSTKINYSIKESGKVKLIVYDVLGRVVNELVNDFQSAGSYSVEFSSANLASGVYYYRISTNNFSEAKKMILLK